MLLATPSTPPVIRVFQQETGSGDLLLFAVRSDYHGALYCVDIAMQNYSGSRVIPVFGETDVRLLLTNLLFFTRTDCVHGEIYREDGGCHVNNQWHPAVITLTGYQDPGGEVTLTHHLHTSEWKDGTAVHDVTAIHLSNRRLRRIVQEVRLCALDLGARV